GDRGGVAGVLLVAERQHADAGGLRHAAEIGDRDAGHAVDRGEAVELEGVDDEMKPIGQLFLRLGLGDGGGVHAGGFLGLTAVRACRAQWYSRRDSVGLSGGVSMKSPNFWTCAAKPSVCSRTRRSARSPSWASRASTMLR